MNNDKKYLTPVFTSSLVITIVVVALAIIFKTQFQYFTSMVRAFIGSHFAWYYLLLVSLMAFVCFFFIFSPAGKIRLGNPDSTPEYSKLSWLAMLFSAGMGIGLVFYGAAEPLSHYAISAPEAQIYSRQALKDSLKYSFFHYGIHAWSIYAIVSLALAYFQFRKKEKTLISATLKPLFGEKTEGVIGNAIDSITIFATVIGVATTLGYGAAQINGGLNYLFGIPKNFIVQLIIIIIATFLFMMSVLSGIGKGVKILSNLNILVAIGLMVFAMAVGPKVQIMNTMVETLGEYMQDFIRMSFRTSAGNALEQAWIQKWTILYWSWWISWSPFVGIFIARISKGRTIREFITNVILVPSVFSGLWFSIFGVMSTHALNNGAELTKLSIEEILFGTLHQYNLGLILSIIAIILVFSFFITSADSATFVLAMQSENRSLNPHTTVKVIWGILLSTIAIVLLLAGGLDALQNVLIIVALPFSIIMLLLMISLVIEVSYEAKKMGLYIEAKKYPSKDEPFRSYED